MSYLVKIRDLQFNPGFYAKMINLLIRKFIRYRKIDSDIDFFNIPDKRSIYICNDGSLISRNLFWLGARGYEYYEAKLWEHLCNNANNVIEMGANIGYFTIIGASNSNKIHYTAIEANPTTAKYLKKNISLNNLKNVNIITAAVVGYKKEQYLELLIPIEEEKENAPSGAYLSGGERIYRHSRFFVKVDVVQANDIIDNVDLLKLDIEGHEFIVLKSIINHIHRLRPIIFVEVRRDTHELRKLISSLASDKEYYILSVNKKGIHEISSEDIKTVVLQDNFNTRDAILVPLEKLFIINSYCPS